MKNIIRTSACLCLVVSSVLCSQAHAQAKKQWIQDEGFGFKIQVPSDYQTSSHLEGTDKIHAFLSPDQNVAVRVRVIPLEAKRATSEQVEKIWRENVLLGAKKEGAQKDKLNGIKGTTFGYRWTFNNTPCIVGAFVTVKRARAYVIWCLVPEPLFQKRMEEMSTITQSFQLLEQNAKPEVVKKTDNPSVKQPPAVQSPAAPTRNASKLWQGLVLDDCKIEFDYPAVFIIQQKKQGQSQWWDAKTPEAARVKMIIQSLDRQVGNTMQSVVKGLLDQVKSTDTATLIESSAVSHPHLPVHQLSFKLDQGDGQVTVFQYAVIDAPGPTVVTISYVTPQANAGKVAPMYKRLLATLKPVKP